MSFFAVNSYARTEPNHDNPALRDRHYPIPLHDLLKVLQVVANDLPRTRFIDYDPSKGEVHLERSTPIIPFTDDIYLYLRKVESGDLLLWGYSASRVGQWDFKVNERNLKTILAEVDKRVERLLY